MKSLDLVRSATVKTFIFSRSSYVELHSFSIAQFLQKPALSVDVRYMFILSHAPLVLLLVLQSTLLILKKEKINEETLVSVTPVSAIHSVAITENDSNSKFVLISLASILLGRFLLFCYL